MKKIKILFFSANPMNTDRLDLDEEIRSIQRKIRSADYRDNLTMIACPAARQDNFIQVLLEEKPDILHFSGHGSRNSELIFLDEAGKPAVVTQEALSLILSTIKDSIKIVFLNACFSDQQAKAVSSFISFTIGMRSSIKDQDAIAFSSSFYRSIAFGRTIEESFRLGQAALILKGSDETTVPVLWVKEGEKSSWNLISESLSCQEAELFRGLLHFLEDRRLLTTETGFQSHFPDRLRLSAQKIRDETTAALRQLSSESILTPILKRLRLAARNFEEATEGALDGKTAGLPGVTPLLPMGWHVYLASYHLFRHEILKCILEASTITGVQLSDDFKSVIDRILSNAPFHSPYLRQESFTLPVANNWTFENTASAIAGGYGKILIFEDFNRAELLTKVHQVTLKIADLTSALMGLRSQIVTEIPEYTVSEGDDVVLITKTLSDPLRLALDALGKSVDRSVSGKLRSEQVPPLT